MFKIVLVSDENPGYTVSVKRRFLPGYKKYRVTSHSWENFRFIFNLASGEQLIIPGFKATAVKVHRDFWDYVASKNTRQNVPHGTFRQGATKEIPETTDEGLIDTSGVKWDEKAFANVVAKPVESKDEQKNEIIDNYQPKDNYVSPEVLKRASERVRGILQTEDIG